MERHTIEKSNLWRTVGLKVCMTSSLFGTLTFIQASRIRPASSLLLLESLVQASLMSLWTSQCDFLIWFGRKTTSLESPRMGYLYALENTTRMCAGFLPIPNSTLRTTKFVPICHSTVRKRVVRTVREFGSLFLFDLHSFPGSPSTSWKYMSKERIPVISKPHILEYIFQWLFCLLSSWCRSRSGWHYSYVLPHFQYCFPFY